MLAILVVDERRVLLEDAVLAAARRVLQLEHRVGIEQVIFAVAAPLVLAAPLQIGLHTRSSWIRSPMALEGFFGDHIDPDAAHT